MERMAFSGQGPQTLRGEGVYESRESTNVRPTSEGDPALRWAAGICCGGRLVYHEGVGCQSEPRFGEHCIQNSALHSDKCCFSIIMYNRAWSCRNTKVKVPWKKIVPSFGNFPGRRYRWPCCRSSQMSPWSLVNENFIDRVYVGLLPRKYVKNIF